MTVNNILKIDSVLKLNGILGRLESEHPLISIIDFSKVKDYQNLIGWNVLSGLYAVMLKQQCDTGFNYGREKFDFKDGSLIFVAPGQILNIENEIITPQTRDWAIFFHPDLLKGTKLNRTIKNYSYFNYTASEALHLSPEEKTNLNAIVEKLEREVSIKKNNDPHRKKIITSNIELLLNYCLRYFDRQFTTRTTKNKEIFSKIEAILGDYYVSDIAHSEGLPTVKYLANNLNLSSNYMSDLLKKETGLSALEHIHKEIIEEAKTRLLLANNSISSVAYELGFKYPQYFTRLFKKETGMTPREFINSN
jgi:YesN/AraC family two-component response regulator